MGNCLSNQKDAYMQLSEELGNENNDFMTSISSFLDNAQLYDVLLVFSSISNTVIYILPSIVTVLSPAFILVSVK